MPSRASQLAWRWWRSTRASGRFEPIGAIAGRRAGVYKGLPTLEKPGSELDPARSYTVLRAYAYAKGHYDRAIADYDEAIRFDPTYAPAYHRGAAYYFKEKYGRAIADYMRVIELGRKNAGCYNNLGYSFLRQGKTAKSVAAIAPQDARNHRSLGVGLHHVGHGGEAMNAWQKACNIASKETSKDLQRTLADADHYGGPVNGRCWRDVIAAFHSCAQAKCDF